MKYNTQNSSRKRSFSVKVIPHNLLYPRQHFQTPELIYNQKPTPPTNYQQLTQILKTHFNKQYVKELVEYFNRSWDDEIHKLIKNKQLLAVSNLVLERTATFKPLLQKILSQKKSYSDREFSVLLEVNYSQYIKMTESFEIALRLASEYIDPIIMEQRQDLDYLYVTVMRLYNPTGIGSQEELKQRFDSLMAMFKNKKSQLAAVANPTLRSSLQFVIQIEKVIDHYQKQTLRYKSLFEQCEKDKHEAQRLLQKKTNFIPVEIDYLKVKEIKDQHKKEIINDLDQNIVKFYKNRMKTYDKKLEEMKLQIQDLDKEITTKNQVITNLNLELKRVRDSKPIHKDASTQISLFYEPTINQRLVGGLGYNNFIENVSSPFKFTNVITSSFIHQLVLDKILVDYEIVRYKHKLKPFKHFVFEWFIIKTGCKIVAQIFSKNFVLSLKSLRKSHKRYQLSAKLMGITQVKQKSLMQDLELVFCQTQLAWYYYMKVLLMYRQKFSINNSGYPILPPVNCQEVMKLPLRKTYQLVNEFLEEEGVSKPHDLNTKFDLYCINQISLFKQGTEQFQKERKQEIHILGEITFDTIAGFLIQYVGNIKCSNAEKFLRTIQTKVREKNAELSYSEFELIYKKIYKERRAKAESLYAKFVMTKQQDTLNLQNMSEVIFTLLEDQTPMRNAFQKMGLLKDLILDERSASKWQIQRKTTSHANSYQNFRERYYLEFYDFYSSVKLLYHLFRSIKKLINKFLYQQRKRQNITLGDQEQSNEQQEHQQYAQKIQMIENSRTPQLQAQDKARKRSSLQQKVEEFKILLTKIPIFPRSIITVEQLVVHSMRRKDSIDITEYSWRMLRQILIIITEKNFKS